MIERIVAGDVPRKHHLVFRGSDGALRHEECITQEGFEGPYTIVYHLHRPHAARLLPSTPHGWAPPVATPLGPLARRHFLTPALSPRGGAPLNSRVPLLFNDDVVVGMVHPDAADPVYFSNGDGDDLFFVMAGGGVVRSIVGDLRFDVDDYVCIPRGLVHRIVPDPGVTQTWLSIECPAGVRIPRQWRNEAGQLRMDAPYCHRDFRHPTFVGPLDEGIREVVIKRAGRFTAFAYAESPLDVVGWDGTVYPWAFPILNFQARAGLVHLPPTWHGTFATRGSLLCSFVPRMVDFHPEAVPCPYPHASVDCDEVLFYVRGNFTSRRGVGPGSISYHPMGVPHGPHPGAYEASIGHRQTNELAVMMDTFKPLHVAAPACAIEDPAYHHSFLETAVVPVP